MYTAHIWGFDLTLETDPALFSPEHPDHGTLAMLSTVSLTPGQTLLDLGCGAGLVGIAAAKILGEKNVVMTDIDEKAVACARKNTEKNDVPGHFSSSQNAGHRNTEMSEIRVYMIYPIPPERRPLSAAVSHQTGSTAGGK